MFLTLSRPTRVALLFCLMAVVMVSCSKPGKHLGAGHTNPPALNALLEAVDVRIAKLQRAMNTTVDSAIYNGPDTQHARTLAASQFKEIPATVYFFDNTGDVVNQIATGGPTPIPWNAISTVANVDRDCMFGPSRVLPDGTPVMDARLERDGVTVVARVHTQPFLESAVESVLGGTNIHSWIMEPDGLQIYEPDPEEVGKNLLTDTMYQEYTRLAKVAREMQDTPWGSGTYDFLNTGFETVVEKRATWDTYALHGISWRVVMVQLQLKGQDVVFPDDSDVIFEARAMKAATHAEPVLSEFREEDELGIRAYFQDFLAKHEGIYNLAYITRNGVILYGEPVENSFDNYDLTEGRRDNDVVLLEAARGTNDTWLVFDLAEGAQGLFHVSSIWDGDTYLGAIYAIWVLPEDEV